MIVGGGPAGSAAAITLARAGYSATLIERNAAASHKVCGDFLSGTALRMIEDLGVDLSHAPRIDALRLVYRDRIAIARLPFAARGLSRRALDEALLQQAQQSGAEVLRGHRIGALHRDCRGIELTSASLGCIRADTLFLATGKHELRGAERDGPNTGLVGLKMYYAPAESEAAALRYNVELVLFPRGYAGLQLVETGQMVLCALIPAARLRDAGDKWDDLLAMLAQHSPHLRQRLSGARALLKQPLAIARLPYGYSYAASRRDPPGLFRLGDQAAVIASLTGGGVSLALESGTQAAHAWLAGGSGPQYHRRFALRVARRLRLASALHLMCLTPRLQPWVVAGCKFLPDLARIAAIGSHARV